ncbi:uncharacterized protein LOC122066038 [Macadamia integrifolia]|uniref:uncharacterized protein LOC122066038 n=1 Tax=Macadamia integrifolia TaxID=60698 RepID=UPI001C4F4E9C|nr:uncharacterized protein LOC122066038 [Macadamia integrifolia]
MPEETRKGQTLCRRPEGLIDLQPKKVIHEDSLLECERLQEGLNTDGPEENYWKGKSIIISSVHASNIRAIRRELWMDLEALSVLAEPWAVVGDFNATLASNEKRKVADSWSHNICGPPSYILAQKLKRLRLIIKTWARENFPNFEIELVRMREALDHRQAQIELQGMDDSLFGQEADAKSTYLVAMKNHEKLWAEKSRIRWLKEGDRNSKFFHHYTKIKRAKNTTRRVKKIDGSINSDRDDIACYMSKVYEDFHKGVPVTDHLDLLDAIPRLIDDVDLLSLDSIPSPNEIKRAVWDLDPESSPGPDGYPGYFFHCCWNIISGDFERAVGDFFTSGTMPPGMNNNLLFLIPKINGAMSLDKFRPLCMGNFFCKIISKILATRLSFLLPRLISEEQGAFQKGKLIHNNIALASKLANIMHSATRGGGLGAKLIFKRPSTQFLGILF